MTFRLAVSGVVTSFAVVLAGCSGHHAHLLAPSRTRALEVRPPAQVALIYTDGFTGADATAYKQREGRLAGLGAPACSWLINPQSNGGSTYEMHFRVPASAAEADLRLVRSVNPDGNAHLAALSEIAFPPKLHQPAELLASQPGSDCG